MEHGNGIDSRVVRGLGAVNCLSWAMLGGFFIRPGERFSLAGTPYLLDLVHRGSREVVIKKGSQVRITTTKFLECVHGCIFGRFRQNVLYMMPTARQVEALSRISFDPILELNDGIRRYLETNTAYLKTFRGRSIYFVGAVPQKVCGTKDSVSLRSIPCDLVIRDEVDLMDEGMVELSRQRLRDSELKLEWSFSTPTYPGYGVDKLWQSSTQNHWEIKCSSCWHYTCLGRDFPRSVGVIDGRWERICVKCGKRIDVKDGQWVPAFPDRSIEGFWVDGLMSPRADLGQDMARLERMEMESNRYGRSEFLRSVLGIASLEADYRLVEEDILSCCQLEPRWSSYEGPSAMGIDVGNRLHYVIGIRVSGQTWKVLTAGEEDSFDGLLLLIHRFGVRSLVIDAQPDIHASRDFLRRLSGKGVRGYRCYYSELMPSEVETDELEGRIKCNRNEWCDRVYSLVKDRQIQFPAAASLPSDFPSQLTQTARTIVENEQTGVKKPRWVKLGDDHYFHALLYFLLAGRWLNVSIMDREQKKRTPASAACRYLIRG